MGAAAPLHFWDGFASRSFPKLGAVPANAGIQLEMLPRAAVVVRPRDGPPGLRRGGPVVGRQRCRLKRRTAWASGYAVRLKRFRRGVGPAVVRDLVTRQRLAETAGVFGVHRESTGHLFVGAPHRRRFLSWPSRVLHASPAEPFGRSKTNPRPRQQIKVAGHLHRQNLPGLA